MLMVPLLMVLPRSSDPLTLPRLAGTRIEAEQIGRLAKASGAQADLWLDLSANEDDLKTRDLQSYRVLHIATHGVLDAMRPQFSGLVLSLVGNKSDDDGFLRTSEVFNLKLGAPLVMLSACESGLGKVKRGEGVIGLSRAFMYAGATTVGVSLWSVADKPTAELMTDFYQRLLGPNPSSVRCDAGSAARHDLRQKIQRTFLLGAVRARGRVEVNPLTDTRAVSMPFTMRSE